VHADRIEHRCPSQSIATTADCRRWHESERGWVQLPDSGARGNNPSITAIILWARVMASAIAQFNAGEGLALSCCASLRAARIAAMTPSTRLRPSSTPKILSYSLFIRPAWPSATFSDAPLLEQGETTGASAVAVNCAWGGNVAVRSGVISPDSDLGRRLFQNASRIPICAAKGMPIVVPGPKKSPKAPAGNSSCFRLVTGTSWLQVGKSVQR
jgi:hypothetical protein